MAWTADDLLSDVRRSGMLPSQATLGTADPDILAQADKEVQTRLMPVVITAREEFYVWTSIQQAVAGTAGYRMSKRNLAGRLRDVLWLSQGDVLNGEVRSLPRIEAENVWKFAGNRMQGEPVGFYLESAKVMLVPAPSSATGALQTKWYTRPGRLVNANTTTARQISTVAADTPAPGTTRITLNGAHSFSVSTPVDIIRGSTPFEFLALDVTPTGASTPTIDVAASALPSDFSTANNAGDWVSSSDTSPVMQLPVELHGTLAQRVVARMLKSLGYSMEAEQADRDATELEREALKLITPRVEGEPRKVGGQMFWRRRVWSGWGR